MGNWADIHKDVLQLIADKVNSFEDKDIVALGMVCKRWRAVAVTQQLPWLMLPPQNGSHLRGFYSLSRTRIYQIPSRESNGKKCYSSRGWLLTVGSDWAINLLHPLTLATFKLPGIKSFGESRYERLSSRPYVRFIERVTLSADPSVTSNFVLTVIHGCPPLPAYWRPGDTRWKIIETTEDDYADAVFCQEKCYFTTFSGKVLVADFAISNPAAKFITQFDKHLIGGAFSETLYLAIIEGSLLVVSRSKYFRRERMFRNKPYQTVKFQIFKLNFNNLSWEELKSLGHWSIFVGDNSSILLDASLVEGCRPNCVYFTDDTMTLSYNARKGTGFDMGIFNIEDRTIEAIIEGEWRNRVSPPIFVDRIF